MFGRAVRLSVGAGARRVSRVTSAATDSSADVDRVPPPVDGRVVVALVFTSNAPRPFILFALIGLTVFWRNFQAWKRAS